MTDFLGALAAIQAAIHSTVWLSTVSPFSIAGLLKALSSGFFVSLLFFLSSRKHVDGSVTQNERLFSAFMDNVPVFAWIKDLEGRYVYVNKLAIARLPPFQSGWLGKTDADLWPGEIGATYRANDLIVVASRKTLETVETLLLDGQQHYLLVSKFPILDHTGALTMVGGTGADITAHKRAENALREAEEKYRDIFENADEGIFQTTPDGQFITANPALARMLGYDSTEELLRSRTDIARQHYVEPARRSEFKQQLEEYGVVRKFEHRAYLKDGRKIWLSENVRSVCDVNGAVLYYEGFTEDVTARKHAEESLQLFRNLIDRSNDAIEVLDSTTLRFLDCNATAHEILGYTREEFLSLSAFDIDPIIDQAMSARLVHEMEKSSFVIFESVHRRKDGSTFPVEINAKTIRLERDYRLAVVRDITERKRAEAALQESEARFRQLSEAAFEAIILHDQGTILEVNQSFCRMYGYERAEVIGKSVLDLALPEFRELLLQKVRLGDTGSYEGPALRKDGTTFRAELAGKPIHYQGRVVRVAAIRDITEQKRNERRQAAQYAVTRVLAESATLAEATPQLLQVICKSLRWKMGEFWRVCDSTNLLCCVETWHVPGLDATAFIEASRQTELAPGVGLPGRVWQSGQPAWIPDVMTDPGFARAAMAAKVGLRGAVAFPILLENNTLGVMLFFSRRTPEVDEDLLKIMSAIGSQIGQFTERKRAEEALLASERRYRDIFAFAPVGIYQSLRDGTLITANKALVKMLGYASVDELLRVKLGSGMYFAEDEREKLIRKYEGLGYAVDVDMQWKRKDGSPICVQLSAQAIKGTNGETEYFEGFVRDITERKRSEEALRESEERYRDLVENSREFICTHDLDGLILSANRAAAEMLGYDSNELLEGKNIRDILAPEVRHEFEQYMASLRERGATSGIMLVETSTGERRMWEYYNSLRTDGVTTPIVRGMARDVTDRKLAEQALLASERKYHDIFAFAPVGIYQSLRDGTIITANHTLAEMLGYASVDELLRVELARDVYLVEGERERLIREHEARGYPIDLELQWKAKDGSPIWVQLTAHAIKGVNDATEYWEGFVRDISERKRAEEALRQSEVYFRSLIEHAADIISTYDANGVRLYTGPSIERVLGYKPEEMIGRSGFELLHPDDRPLLSGLFAQAVQIPGTTVTREFRCRHKDGTWRMLESTASNLLGNPAVGAVVLNSRDITERRRAEEALRESEERYRDLVENSREFICTHDLDGLILSANRAAAEMLGYDLKDCCGKKNYRDLLVPEVRDQFDDYLARIRRDGVASGLTMVQTSSGERRLWEYYNTLRTEGVATPIVRGMARDITEQKRADTRSAAFANLAQKLSGAMTPLDAGQIIAQTAHDLFGWDSCTLDLYDAEHDVIHPMLNVDTIGGKQVDVTPFISGRKPTPRGRRVIDHGPELILRKEPFVFDKDAVPFGDLSRPSAAMMTAPIRHASRVIGVLSIQSYRPLLYDDVAMGDLQALADHCGEALNRIQAEEQLRESEERYRDLVENSRELICTHDLDGLILSANRAATEVLGDDRENYFGKKNLREILTPEALEGFEDYLARIRNDWVASGIMLVQTNSGEQRIWEYYNTLRTEGVAAPIVRGMARDITESRRAEEALRESEERYRELFENAKDAIYVHDLNGICTSVNRATEQLLGYSREEIVGKHFSDFLAPEYLPRVRNQLGKKLTDQRPASYEVEVVARDGRRVPVELSSNLVCEDGVPVGIQGIARDITERKRAAELLQTFPRRLIEAQEAERKRIARELHDEIGQVLTAITLNLQAVRASGLTPTSMPKIDESILVVNDALHHVQNLALELRPSLLDDLGLAAAIRWFVDRYAQRTGIKTEVATDAQIAEGRLSRELETACFRIVQEALTNVARHAEAKTVSIHFRSLSDEICISIKDDGVGFDAGAGNGAATPIRLGLRGMEERALALGGRLEIKSVPARGTEIRAYFPNE